MSWYNPTSWFIDKENLDAGNAAAEKLKTLNEEDYGQGGRIYNAVEDQYGTKAAEDTYATVLKQGKNQVMSYDEAVNSVNQAFWDEIDKPSKPPLDWLTQLINAFFKAVPWYVWAVVVIVLFIQLGGGNYLKKQLAKA